MKRLILLLAAVVLVACRPAVPAKRYPLHGVVVALDEKAMSATIKHDEIAGWMEAMTMEFSVKPASEFRKLKVGQTIDAIVVVTEGPYYITEIKVAGS